jgi:subtilisin family serine protease
MRRALLALAVAAFAAAAPAAAFAPSDPLAAKQWYLQDDHAFDAWAEPPAFLEPVKVAIVDSGVDCSLPDFQGGRLLDARSFVGGDPCVDTEGHGTFIAG